jgi:hypothetical protein
MGLGVGDAVGSGVAVAVAMGVGDGLGWGVAEGVGRGVGDEVGLGVGEGVGVAAAARTRPGPIVPSRPDAPAK